MRQDDRDAQLIHLTSAETSVVLAALGRGMPSVAYWGSPLTDAEAEMVDLASSRPVARASLDVDAPLGLVAETGQGFTGVPGIEGHRLSGNSAPDRFGGGYSPRFGDGRFELTESDLDSRVVWHLDDQAAALALELTATLCRRSEVLAVQVSVTNTGQTDYVVDRLAPSLPLPAWADELLTFSGRWTLEFQPQRQPWQPGAWVSENRRGRTSHDRIPALFAGTDGFDETTGQVWGLTLGWSGNSRVVVERLSDGRRHIQMGELLLSGEGLLEPGQTLTAPVVYGAQSESGLAEVSQSFHRYLRSRAHHPGPDRPRPVMLNTWEAFYFDHDVAELAELASRAAEVGVERFVLDDGWFVGRNDDTAALGDWIVDRAKYPDGLGPLVDHVNDLGMEFGLWFEPEMVNPDSDLYRQHPEWVLHDLDYPHLLARNQLVLDLANPDAWNHVLSQMDAVLSDYNIGYIKWDMNRDHLQPTDDGRAGSRRQTLAVYALFDEIRRRHPNLEIESCSSGGARADFEILARSERIWTSDSNDALDRQHIQRGFSMLFPPELMGSHVGPPVSHTTGRHHDLGLRAGSAFLGHLGIEWNLLTTSEAERREIADFVSLHKRHRRLLHGGDWYRLDSPDPTVNVMGVVAPDSSEALFVYARTGSTIDTVHSPVRFDGLDPGRSYRVANLPLPGPSRDRGTSPPRWLADAESEPIIASGRVLMNLGLQPPVMDPESAMVFHLDGNAAGR